MSKVVVVSDLEGRVIGIAQQPVGKGVAITARPREGQAVHELELPAEFEKHDAATLHHAVKVDHSSGTPKLVKR